jgi:dsDNA-specific endonuclease/ATPase MutS2
MDQQNAKLFAAELRTDLPTLDLHGLYPDEALDKVDVFLYNVRGLDSAVRIVYGGGTGKLGEVVVSYLQRHPMVATLHDQGGSCVCVFN